jgi:tetratricopeptide (TPR) repeat protein
MEHIRALPARHPVWTASLLAGLIAAAFGKAVAFGYIPLDDPDYVQRAQVAGGLTVDGVRWAFTSFDQANWHPLTWLSYMADVSAFGASPGVFHATNVALHAVACGVLFLALRSLTAAPWRSLLAAVLFGIHPLRVESVAWIAERKDVLSGLLFAGLLLAWSRYARAGGWARYVVVAALLALGLLAKPTVVTAPFVLLLLDVWPLGRTSLAAPADDAAGSPAPLLRLLAEKVPLLALSFAASAVTLVAQGSGGAFSDVVPLHERLMNATVAVGAYLVKAVWPASLAVFYPYRLANVSAPALVASGAAILAVTALAVWQFRKRPWVAIGWCWYLGMLVPVLGIVQVGGQAMADRYTYLPLIGVAIAVAWGIGEAVEAAGRWRIAAIACVGVALSALAVVTEVQVSTWRDETALFEHAAAVTDGNWLAHDFLGTVAYKAGKRDEAARHFLESVRMNPDFANAHFHLGLLLSDEGDQVNAVAEYRRAIALFPGNPVFHNNLGNALYFLGRRDEAIGQYREALRLDPAYSVAAENLSAVGGR